MSGEHLDTAIDLLSDMVLNASLNKSDVDRERTVIIEEIKMYQDLPNHHVHDILGELMWPEHPLGMSIAGSIESVSSISRESLSDYKNKNYISKNMAVVICGNLGKLDIQGRVKKIFGACPKKEDIVSDDFKNSQSGPRIRILNKGTAQSHLAIGLHSFGRQHKDRYALNLLHIILGANMSSRLFESVREQKGLAYEIATEVKRYKETGAFVVHAGTEHKKVKEAVSVIIKELRKIKELAVTKDELRRAKEFFKVQLLMALEDTVEHMLWLGEGMISFGKLPDKKEIIKKVEAITEDDITRVSNAIFKSQNLNLALIGALNENEQKDIEKELGQL